MAVVALFGAGGVGSLIARGLAASPFVGELVLVARNTERLAAEAMDLRIAAENAGNDRFRVRTLALDLADGASVADALAKARPEVVVHATTMRSWFTIAAALPLAQWRAIYAATRFGPWLPINLAPALRLMKAVVAAGIPAATVNVCFPDAVNPILARMDLPPTTGSGNSEIVASVLRISAAELLGTSLEPVAVRLIGHHFHLANLDHDIAWGERALHYRILHDGRDVTHDLDPERFRATARRNCPHKSSVPAAVATVRNIERLLGRDAGAIVHCSAPEGREGGWDVRFEGGRPVVVLPNGVTQDEADAVVRRAAEAEGIAEIMADGAVRFGAAEAEAMRRHLGYDCPVLRPDEIEDRGRELLARFDALAAA
ncbi:MAG: saccharopine dehydrogenase NADP-binding domain-containing protein [Alphaproteobacteria bacterium]